MRIDSHVHLYDPAFGDFSWPPPGSPFYRRFWTQDLCAAIDGTGMDAAVLVGCAPEAALTRIYLEATGDEPLVAAVVGEMQARDEGFIPAYNAFCAYPKFRGLRVAAAGVLFTEDSADIAPRAAANIAHMNGRAANVLELLGNWRFTARLEPLVAANPGVRFVIQHCGGFLFTGEAPPAEYTVFLARLAAYPNVYIKLSGLFTLARVSPRPLELPFYRPALDACLRAFGPQRCLFGSDWPVMGPEYARAVALMDEFIQSYGPDAAAQVMGDTARTLYKLPQKDAQG